MIQPFSRARDITAALALFVPRDFHAVWPRSVGDAAWRRADHAWSDLASPYPRNPWRDAEWRGTSAAQASKSRECTPANHAELSAKCHFVVKSPATLGASLAP